MMDLLSFVLENRQKGFTLIETALAMLAIGLGLLAIFGLGRLGLQTAKETEYDQRCALMADAIFETLRDYNARFVEEARTNGVVSGTWEYLWEQARQNKFDIPFPPIANMSASPKILLRFTEPNSFAATFDKDNLSLTDWNPLYSLTGNFLNPPSPGPFTALHITLVIHPDGLTYSSDQRLFRTTLTNPGGLP
ncbi:MAG: type IV pilus modification PilV family protein [Kiritimatiellia bacterium]|jgi:prepilin-type N-terminal cleavage/methylation domain-containing protein